MIGFLKKHWTGIVITVIALWIVRAEYLEVGFYRWRMPNSINNSFFGAMGLWGIRFLLLSLLMSPIYAFTGWRFPLKLRKPLGLVAFMFVSIHAYIHLSAKFVGVESYDLIGRLKSPQFVIYGAIAFVILAAMAATSIKPTMKLMGRFWKPLHRLVYVAAILMMVHSVTAVTNTKMSKRAFMGGAEVYAELKIYLVILLVLLVLRIPIVKRTLQALIPFAPNPRKTKAKRSLVAS